MFDPVGLDVDVQVTPSEEETREELLSVIATNPLTPDVMVALANAVHEGDMVRGVQFIPSGEVIIKPTFKLKLPPQTANMFKDGDQAMPVQKLFGLALA